MVTYQVSFPEGLDRLDWADIEDKGWLEGVRVILEDREIALSIFDESRLSQAIAIDFNRLGFFATKNLLVLRAVTRGGIESAIDRMADRNFSDI